MGLFFYFHVFWGVNLAIGGVCVPMGVSYWTGVTLAPQGSFLGKLLKEALFLHVFWHAGELSYWMGVTLASQGSYLGYK